MSFDALQAARAANDHNRLGHTDADRSRVLVDHTARLFKSQKQVLKWTYSKLSDTTKFVPSEQEILEPEPERRRSEGENDVDD
jgi:hypothetical protein